MNLKAIVHTEPEGGFWAEVPSLPGCVSQGETIDELRLNLHEAISVWLEAGEPEASETEQILEVAL
jgi:predicted RNase H-like HicB family nuclease